MAIKIVLHQPYRQLVGLVLSIFTMTGLSLPLPHFTTVAVRARQLGKHFKTLSTRRPKDLVFDSSGFKVYGEGEWKAGATWQTKTKKMEKISYCDLPRKPRDHTCVVEGVADLLQSKY